MFDRITVGMHVKSHTTTEAHLLKLLQVNAWHLHKNRAWVCMCVYVWMCAYVRIGFACFLFSVSKHSLLFVSLWCKRIASTVKQHKVFCFEDCIETIPKHRHKHEPINNRKKKIYTIRLFRSSFVYGTFYGKILRVKYGQNLHRRSGCVVMNSMFW